MSFLEALLGPDHQKRYWSWYEGGDNATLLPGQADPRDPEGRRPGRWAPAALLGDTLGVLGTLRDIAKDEFIQPAMGETLRRTRQIEDAAGGVNPIDALPLFGVPGGAGMIRHAMQGTGDLVRPEAAEQAMDGLDPFSPAGRAAARDYLRQSTPAFLSGMGREMISDPSSYLGGGLAGAPKAIAAMGARLGPVGQAGFKALSIAAEPAAAVDRAYIGLSQAGINLAREAAPALGALPGIRHLLEPDTWSQAVKIVDTIADGLTWGRIRKIPLTPWAGKKGRIRIPGDDPAAIAHGTFADMEAIEASLRTAHPLAAAAALRVVRAFQGEKALAERAVARQDFDAELEFLSGALRPDDLAAVKEALWKGLAGHDRATAKLTKDTVDTLAAIPWPSLSPADEAAARTLVQQATEATRAAAAHSRQVGRLFQATERLSQLFGTGPVGSAGRLSGVARSIEATLRTRGTAAKSWAGVGAPGTSAREDVEAIASALASAESLSPEAAGQLETVVKDFYEVLADGAVAPDALSQLLAAAPDGVFGRAHLRQVTDRFYAQTRQQIDNVLGQLDHDLEPVLGPNPFPDESGDALARWQQDYGSLAEVQGGGYNFIPHVPGPQGKAMAEYDRSINQTLTGLLAARLRVLREVEPALRQHWADLGFDQAAIDDQLLNATASGQDLINALTELGNRDLLARTSKALAAHGGDLLDDQALPALLIEGLTKRVAKDLGWKEPSAVAAAWRLMIGAWVNLALLSPKYLQANLISILFLTAHHGMDATQVIRRIGQHSHDLVTHLRHRRWEEAPLVSPPTAESMPVARAVGLADEAGDRILQNPSFSATTQTNFTAPGLGDLGGHRPGQSVSAIGRLHPALRTAGFGAGMAIPAWLASPEEDRARNAAIAGGVGAGFGAAVPKLAYGLGLLSSVIENAGRNTAWYHGLEQSLARDLPQFEKELGAYLASVGGRAPVQSLAPEGRAAISLPSGPGHTGMVLDQVRMRSQAILDHIAGRSPRGAPMPELSPAALGRLMADHGFRPQDANWAARRLSEIIHEAQEAGTALSNRVNIDYRVQTRAEAWLKQTGIMPFVTWQARLYPVFLRIMAEHPAYLAALHALSTLSEQDAEEGGLTGRYAMMAKSGELGRFLADHLLDRKGDILINPLTMVLPFADLARPTPERDERTSAPLDPLADQLARLGVGVSPLVTLPAEATGLLSPRGGTAIRTTPMLAAAASSLGGNAADLEYPIRQGVNAVRRSVGAPVDESVTGNPMYDWQIRTRIAEMAVEQSGGKAAWQEWFGPGVMDDPDGPVWRQAQEEVDRANSGLTLMNQTLPSRFKVLSDTEVDVRGRMKEQGVSPDQLRGLSNWDRITRQTLARRSDPAAGAFANTGSSSASRLWEEWRQVQALVNQLPAGQRSAWLDYYRRKRPEFGRLFSGQ